jgi:hypothetical protein
VQHQQEGLRQNDEIVSFPGWIQSKQPNIFTCNALMGRRRAESVSEFSPAGLSPTTSSSSRGKGPSRSSSRYPSWAHRVLWSSWGFVQWYLLSPHFQLGLQLAVGIILTSLPSFVR